MQTMRGAGCGGNDVVAGVVDDHIADGRRRMNRAGEWAKWSDREIARRCHVGAPLVGRVRGEMVTADFRSDANMPPAPIVRQYTGTQRSAYAAKLATLTRADGTRVREEPPSAILQKVDASTPARAPTVAEAASERHDCVTVNIHGEKADEHRS